MKKRSLNTNQDKSNRALYGNPDWHWIWLCPCWVWVMTKLTLAHWVNTSHLSSSQSHPTEKKLFLNMAFTQKKNVNTKWCRIRQENLLKKFKFPHVFHNNIHNLLFLYVCMMNMNFHPLYFYIKVCQSDWSTLGKWLGIIDIYFSNYQQIQWKQPNKPRLDSFRSFSDSGAQPRHHTFARDERFLRNDIFSFERDQINSSNSWRRWQTSLTHRAP